MTVRRTLPSAPPERSHRGRRPGRSPPPTPCLQTLELTKGGIDLPIEVADRCKTALTSPQSSKIMMLLIGKGDPWERDYVARTAVELLRSPTSPMDDGSTRLQTRLIELRYHEAAELGGQGPNP